MQVPQIVKRFRGEMAQAGGTFFLIYAYLDPVDNEQKMLMSTNSPMSPGALVTSVLRPSPEAELVLAKALHGQGDNAWDGIAEEYEIFTDRDTGAMEKIPRQEAFRLQAKAILQQVIPALAVAGWENAQVRG